MAWVAGKYALRSVGRNVRRTILSIIGIAIGCALALLMESTNRGRDDLFARVGAEGGSGHLRVVPGGWAARRDVRLRLAGGAVDLEAARGLPGVVAATPRARAQVLLAMGTHVVPVELVGVDPVSEPRTFRFVRTLVAGRYLRPDERGVAVVGRAIADRLEVDLDDEIMATAVGQNGRLESAMLRIVGLASTGSEDIDAGIAQVGLADIERLTGLAGLGEVTIILRDYRDARAARAALAARVAPGDEVLTASEVTPEFEGHMEQDKATSRLVSKIILFIVFLGVASAQLAAVLERRRELAVLAALGMGAARLVRLVVVEALTVGLAGAALGLGIALPVLRGYARHGLDLSRWMGPSYSFQGLIVDPILYGDLGLWVVPYTLAVALGATLVASLYPAWFAARTDPAVALRSAA
jgi:ABC-type lipoprotein release transport system permease subunit